jgi:hypothetical protein
MEECASSKNSAIDRASIGRAWGGAAVDGLASAAGAAAVAGRATCSEKNVISRGRLLSVSV